MTRVKKITHYGEYTVYEGKLAVDDARGAYVTGPTIAGRIAPLASYWNVSDAVREAKRMDENRVTMLGPGKQVDDV